jgi:hypothetical protein
MSSGLTFYQARAISAGNQLQVRRTSWSDPNQWFMSWRGQWWFFTTGVVRPVEAGDWGKAELLADDWTAVPAALAACPIDASTGSTGGGPPAPGIGGFTVNDPTTVDLAMSGSGISSGISGGITLPTPDPKGDSLTVSFTGLFILGPSRDFYSDFNSSMTVSCAFSGGEWKGSGSNGKVIATGAPIVWEVTVAKFGTEYSVDMATTDGPNGGFTGLSASPINNLTAGTQDVSNGTATVSAS